MLEKLKELIADQLNADADSITAETRFKEICLNWLWLLKRNSV